MSRAVPWRNKPIPLISQMLPIAKQLKLYLVNEIGPTSLILKDQNQNKFKVVIGDTVNCSCGVIKNDHCIHSLFVMLKKFKVSQNHPIIWQASYLDSQLDGLTQFKYQNDGKSKTKTTAKQFLKKKKDLVQNEQGQDFPHLDDDQMCPICYQQMNGQCYSTCDTCHKSLHTKCFKVWTKHKQDSMSPVTCPMCRTKFITPMKIIFRDFQRWESRFSTHKGINCKDCGQKNIKGLVYKCLTCPNTDLCKLCYEGNQHIEHDIFCVKELSTDAWRLAPIRIKKTRKQLFQPIDQINLRQFPSLQSNDFILQLLPTVKQFNQRQAKSQLGIVGNQLLTKNICLKCHTLGNDEMLRLNCSHSIHPECLVSMVQLKQYACQLDGDIICPGYWKALGFKLIKPKPKNNSQKLMRNTQQTQIQQRNHQNKQSYQSKDLKLGKKHQRELSLKPMNQMFGVVTKQSLGGMNRISGIKVKEQKIMPVMRPPTMPKKTVGQRRQEIESLSIGGLGVGFGTFTNQPNFTGSHISSQLTSALRAPPKVPRVGSYSDKNIQR